MTTTRRPLTLPPRAHALAALPLAVLLAASCAPAQPAPPPPQRIDLDVVVHADAVQVVLDTQGACDCPRGEWPAADACVEWTDHGGCSCDPAACIDGVRLERGALRGDVDLGGASTEASVGVAYGVDRALDPALHGDVVLVVEGCGGVARVPLSLQAPPVPRVVDYVADADSARLLYESDDPTAAGTATIACSSGGFGGTCCRQPYAANGAVVVDAPSIRRALYGEWSVTQLAGGATTTTDIGDVRVWRSAQGRSPTFTGVVVAGDGRFAVPAPFVLLDGTQWSGRDAEATIDLGAPDPASTLRIVARISSGEPIPRLDYTAGIAEDYLVVFDGAVAREASFAHAAFDGPLPFGLDTGPVELTASAGAVDLVNVDEPADVVTVDVSIEWGLFPLPRWLP